MKRIKQTVLPQAKLLKLFQLIATLKAGRWAIKDLIDRFDSSKSSMYRYMELLEEAGFFIEKDFHDRYFIVTTDDDPLQASFTLEEMHLLRTLMQGDGQHPLAAMPKNTAIKITRGATANNPGEAAVGTILSFCKSLSRSATV